ncbi:hypothetical protein QBC46DRAFT_402992 [Diplogelasinospora grovesii]|uniref:Mcm2 3 5 family protein n=1 Tax=Diplogelasinospora grovesii TaxID=303347 RepID=A0AAN6NHJ5_9PEZI|nr:hypothetical protein QBC46DRAFT_402992 [Diplogelasinospora grovesii]
MALWVLSVFSTVGSLTWLVIAIRQPRWGWIISSGGLLSPATASLIMALFAKLIEMSFVAVFVAFVGQVLTKRAFDRESSGTTLAEISMRNWVVQPGLMITDGAALKYTVKTALGFICIVATFAGTLYTTASDALVSPKLKFGAWEPTVLQSYAMASYGNLPFVREQCETPINEGVDAAGANACVDVSFSGTSYHNFQSFMAMWQDFGANNTGAEMADRPAGTAILFDNTTLTAAWIESEFSDPKKNFATYGRIVNNVTLAMPHPGVYLAATDPINRILQPSDLSGVGEYAIKASAVSPAVNVLCANMSPKELEPLIYTTWPDANNTFTSVPGQQVGWAGWTADVPVASPDEWLNRTVVDDIFRWGSGYGRRPPVFSMYPLVYNMIANASVYMSDAVYLLSKSNDTTNYTLCEMRSWLSPKCSTQFNISGTSGAHMRAHCEDKGDLTSYLNSVPDAPANSTSADWRNLADEWHFALDINSGYSNGNASRDRMLTQMILTEPQLPKGLPSIAEGLAVLVSSTLVTGSLNTPLRHSWDQPTPAIPAPGVLQPFNATIMTQQYTSSYTNDWQAIFYVVLLLVFLLNLLCLFHFALHLGGRLLTDYTEPANLFALAVNSPPSVQLRGSCGGGPADSELVVPWRVGYEPAANHYFFEEASTQRRRRRRGGRTGGIRGTGGRGKRGDFAASGDSIMGLVARDTGESLNFEEGFKRLSNSNSWL